jgi:hypothetical protein
MAAIPCNCFENAFQKSKIPPGPHGAGLFRLSIIAKLATIMTTTFTPVIPYDNSMPGYSNKEEAAGCERLRPD